MVGGKYWPSPHNIPRMYLSAAHHEIDEHYVDESYFIVGFNK